MPRPLVTFSRNGRTSSGPSGPPKLTRTTASTGGSLMRPPSLPAAYVEGMPGPVALVGSGEYLPVMLETERLLLQGRPPRYVQIPTAAAPEGEESLDRWVTLRLEQAARLE